MTAKIVSQANGELTIQVNISLKGTMLESEQSIVECVNQVGMFKAIALHKLQDSACSIHFRLILCR